MKSKSDDQALSHHEITIGTTGEGMGGTRLKSLPNYFARLIADNCTVKMELKPKESRDD